jgi:hypothetical protein
VVVSGATVRAAEAIEKHGWKKVASEKFLGSEEEVPDLVDLDDYCVPEVMDEAA